MAVDYLEKHLEALIFCHARPVSLSSLQACMTEFFETDIPLEDIQQAVGQLQERYRSEDYSFEVVEAGGGFQFMTKPAFQQSIALLLKQTSKKRLSRSALETLSIIAYRQPVSRPEIEQVRGVNCDYALKKLLDKQLIEIRGKSDAVGRPLLYGTSDTFLEYFGINHIGELPSLKEFEKDEAEIGTAEDGEEAES